MDTRGVTALTPAVGVRAPAWTIGLLGGILLWSLVTDVQAAQTRFDGSVAWWLHLLKVILDHVALVLAGVRPHVAAVLIWCVLPITVATGDIGMTVLSLSGVTAAVLALCGRGFAVGHLVVATVWVVVHAVVRTVADAEWTILLFLIPATLAGLVIRFFLVRAAGEQERVRAATNLLNNIRDQERSELSRELHDAVASGLALISMETTSVEDSRNPDELRRALGVVQQVSRSTSAELRLLVNTLREPAGTAMGPTAEILTANRSLAALTTELTGSLTDRGYLVAADLTGLDIPADELLRPVLHTWLRILQESVTNIIRHAPPQASCHIWARATDTTLRLVITNELTRTAAESTAGEPSGGVGLKGIQERAALTSGSVSHGPRDHEWVVDATLPLHPNRLG